MAGGGRGRCTLLFEDAITGKESVVMKWGADCHLSAGIIRYLVYEHDHSRHTDVL